MARQEIQWLFVKRVTPEAALARLFEREYRVNLVGQQPRPQVIQITVFENNIHIRMITAIRFQRPCQKVNVNERRKSEANQFMGWILKGVRRFLQFVYAVKNRIQQWQQVCAERR